LSRDYLATAIVGEISSITLVYLKKGEQTTQACEIAWLRQLSTEAAKIGIGERDL
jgi:hypothetical protein